MTTETLPATTQGTDEKRQLALLKAVGLDKAAPEQREIALAIANRYDLDLLLKHLVLIEGRPFITRDGLLHIAHRSGKLDGIETTVPEITGDEWRVTCSVYRKDMSRPFTYTGRYPVKGGHNARFAPEMATKVAEAMALRRAFDVAAPTQDERWDLDVAAAIPPEPAPSLAERAAAKAAEVAPAPVEEEPAPYVDDVSIPLTEAAEAIFGDVKADTMAMVPPLPPLNPIPQVRCDDPNPYEDDGESCAKEKGHNPPHRNHAKAKLVSPVNLEDLDLFPNPDGPRPGAPKPRRCLHGRRWINEDGIEQCRLCGKELDPTVTRRGKNNRARGLSIQRKVLALMGLEHIPGNGPTDGRSVGENALHVAEVKSGARFNAADYADITKLPVRAGQLRWLVKVETPGPGHKARVVVMTVLEDWLDAFGPSKEGL